jgi:hypothetical protein
MPDTDDRQPLEEIANRTATAGAGLAAAAKAVGLADHKRMLEDHARRVRDGHRVQMRSLGMEASEPEDDEMGDVFVCGDITQPTPTSQPPIAATQKILPYVLAAALAGGGLGVGGATIPILMALANQGKATTPVAEQPTVPATDADTQYELRISRGE